MVPYRGRVALRIARLALAISCLAWYALRSDDRFASILAILAALCWLSARLAKRAGGTPAARTSPDPAEALASSKAAGFLTRVLPYVTVVIAAFAPLAAAIYLLTTVAWTLEERRVFLYRPAHAASAPVPETQ